MNTTGQILTDRGARFGRGRARFVRRVMVFIALPILGGLVCLLLYARFLSETAADPALMIVAGRQQLAVEDLRAWGQMVTAGDSNDRGGLQERIEEFDRTLGVLRAGGVAVDRTLPPPPPEVAGELDALATLWAQTQPELLRLAEGDPAAGRAWPDTEAQLRSLLGAAEALSGAYEARTLRLRHDMFGSLLGLGACLLLLLVAGYGMLRRYVMTPLVAVDSAARHLLSEHGQGLLIQRTTGDMLSAPAATFWAMAEEIGRLIELSNDQRRYAERIVASVPAGLAVLDINLVFLQVNSAFIEISGVEEGEILGHPLAAVLRSSALEAAALEALHSRAERRGLRVERPRGSERPQLLRVALAHVLFSEGGGQLLLVAEDLTEEEQLRTRARSSELRFNEVVEHATDGVVMVDRAGLITYFNRAAEALFGFRRDEVVGRPVQVLASERYTELYERGVWDSLAGEWAKAPATPHQLKGRRKDGTVFPVECTVSMCRIEGQLVFTGTLRDISDRLRVEEALERSERSFRALIEATPDAIAVHRGGRFVYVNPAMIRLLQRQSPAELIGEPVSAVLHEDDLSVVAERIRTMMTTGELAPPWEERFIRKDGSILYAEVVALPLQYQGEPAIVAIGRDITARREIAARMMQMDRIIAVGTLAAGVGHEINNPLTYVNANVSFALEYLDELRSFGESIAAELDRRLGAEAAQEILAAAGASRQRAALSDLREVLGDARDGGDRIRHIVLDLKTFSRSDDEQRKLLQVAEIAQPAIDMAFNELRHRASLVTEFGNTPPIMGNKGQLGQVLLNLLINAAQAIPEGRIADNEIRVRSRLRGAAVAIEVCDTGQGIRDEDRPRIFDAFFTTKPVGQGTGLGLSICRQIVEAHGGTIEIESQLGEGSVFRVLLPAATGAAAPASTPAAPAPPGRRGRLLIIDDEPMITRSMQRTLGALHEVQVMTSARMALALLEVGERFDLILCDLMMPDMTGMALYEALRSSAPEYIERIVFMTGGAFTPSDQAFLEHSAAPYLRKPFGAEHLKALVQSLLD